MIILGLSLGAAIAFLGIFVGAALAERGQDRRDGFR